MVAIRSMENSESNIYLYIYVYLYMYIWRLVKQAADAKSFPAFFIIYVFGEVRLQNYT